jgi:SAM-dependent methyltransferase
MDVFDPKAYWETRLAKNPGLTGVGYAGLGNRYNEWLYKVRRRIFLREVGSLPGRWEEAEVLDVGSGTGFYTQRWKEIGVRSITGSDLTDISISRLQQEFSGEKFIRLDIGASLAELPTLRFNAISAFDVLFHITDDQRYETAISNVHTMLKPGGWFIFSDNFLHFPTERATHQVSRSLAEVGSILQKAGFQVVRRRPMFVLMNYPVDTKSRIRKSIWKLLMYPVYRSEFLGGAVGATLYPVETVLTGVLRESSSTEIMICRKVSSPTSPTEPLPRVL